MLKVTAARCLQLPVKAVITLTSSCIGLRAFTLAVQVSLSFFLFFQKGFYYSQCGVTSRRHGRRLYYSLSFKSKVHHFLVSSSIAQSWWTPKRLFAVMNKSCKAQSTPLSVEEMDRCFSRGLHKHTLIVWECESGFWQCLSSPSQRENSMALKAYNQCRLRSSVLS